MSSETTREEILNDAYLSAIYQLAYGELARHLPTASVSVLEIGAGLGIAESLGHQWWRSELAEVNAVHLRASAQAIAFRAQSLDGIILKDTWHHIPDIETFLTEAHRTLIPGGVVVVIDPYWGALARFVYRFLHQERWEITRDWHFSAKSPWDSNQALSYLMLRRHRDTFDARWADLFAIEEHSRHIGPSFLLSGGVSRRTPISGVLLRGLLKWEERRGKWFDHLRFFHVFTLTKL